MTACSAGSTWKTVTHTGAFVVVLGLSLGSSGIAFGADSTAPTTVRAAIGADGAVRSVVSLGGNTTAPDKAALPVTMSITDQLDGKDLGADRAGQDAASSTACSRARIKPACRWSATAKAACSAL